MFFVKLNLQIYVFLYQNLNLHQNHQCHFLVPDLCISILEFKFKDAPHWQIKGAEFMYFYIRI